jgi:16S rRNA (guanine527-N7)-methyltransferase
VKHAERRPTTVDAESVRSALDAAGVPVSLEQAEALAHHADLVLAANERMNLTAIKDVQEFVELHIVDSLAAVHEAVGGPEGPMVDIGTGGGYPGIPLAIVTGRPCVLLEATQKKAVFLEEVVETIGLPGVSVVNARAEEYADASPGFFSLAVVRGVGELATVVELAAPLLRVGGRLLAYKGRPPADELDRGARAAKLCGMAIRSERRYELPSGHQRVAIVYEKIAEPTVRLPRRPGMAAKRPLG